MREKILEWLKNKQPYYYKFLKQECYIKQKNIKRLNVNFLINWIESFQELYRSFINDFDMLDLNNETTTLAELYDKYVPMTGKADTVAGEIIRAFARINYRYFNDGDCIGYGYGRETVSPCSRYLKKTVKDEKVKEDLKKLYLSYQSEVYDSISSRYSFYLSKLSKDIMNYLKSNKRLFLKINDNDMYSY